MTHPQTPLVFRAEEALMRDELVRLNSPLALLRSFPAALEPQFETWLDARLRSLLGQYLWALVAL